MNDAIFIGVENRRPEARAYFNTFKSANNAGGTASRFAFA
jgi:hypothetical protein